MTATPSEDDEHQPQAVHEHDDEQCDRRDAGIEHLRDAHGDELAQRVGIVGVDGHDVAVGMRIEIADGQRLHLGEHIVADVAQKSLRDDRHRLVVEDGGGQRDDVHRAHAEDDPEERAGDVRPRRALFRQRGDDPREDELQEHGGADARRRRGGDADEYGDQPALYSNGTDSRKQPAEKAEGVHFRPLRRGIVDFTHGRSPPSAASAAPALPILFCE